MGLAFSRGGRGGLVGATSSVGLFGLLLAPLDAPRSGLGDRRALSLVLTRVGDPSQRSSIACCWCFDSFGGAPGDLDLDRDRAPGDLDLDCDRDDRRRSAGDIDERRLSTSTMSKGSAWTLTRVRWPVGVARRSASTAWCFTWARPRCC